MISNCLLVAVAFKATHERCRLRATLTGKGPGGVFPHFYVVLGGAEIHFRSIRKPLPWWGQIAFDGRLVIKRIRRDACINSRKI